MKINGIKRIVVCFIFTAASTCGLFAQDSGASGPDNSETTPIVSEEQPIEEVRKGRSFSGLQLLAPAVEIEAAMLGLTPLFTFYADLGFRLGTELILAPRVGFAYSLPLWETTLDDMYVPLGFRLSLPRAIFLESLYYLPLALDFEKIRFRITAGGEAILAAGSSAAFGISAGLGMGIFIFTDTKESHFPVSLKVGFRLNF